MNSKDYDPRKDFGPPRPEDAPVQVPDKVDNIKSGSAKDADEAE